MFFELLNKKIYNALQIRFKFYFSWKVNFYVLPSVSVPFIDAVLKDPKLQDGQLFNHLAETLSSWEARADLEKMIKQPATWKVLLNF